MAQIAQRLNLDMLTMSGSVEASLSAQGVDVARDSEFMALVEPETLLNAYRLQMAAGAQVLVTATEGITPARLAKQRMEDHLEDLAVSALEVGEELVPQLFLVAIGQGGLPLEARSDPSMKEHRDQYARVARVFERYDVPAAETGVERFDGYLLCGFQTVAEVKAACSGIRMVSHKPLFVMVDVDTAGNLSPKGTETLEDAACAAVEFGSDVVGFSTHVGPEAAAAFVSRVRAVVDVPVAVELKVDRVTEKGATGHFGVAGTGADLYDTPDTMLAAAYSLRHAGAQFLRASGQATPAYTAVLAAATSGLDVVCK